MSEFFTAAAGNRFGEYEVLSRLKSGGMGEVLLARKCGAGGFEKLVAIKTIRAEFRGAEEPREMFLDEARLLAHLNHPAIAQVHDFGEDNQRLYLVMEYVEGIHFRALSERHPPAEIAARAIAEVCRGLHAAHELSDRAGNALGVVHRDVTPENLMLTFSGRIKILDFGIALTRGRQAPATELGTIKGKPPYLSPEQLKNHPVDRRTDVFSAAIVLYELLTGEPLFVGDSVYAVARAIEHEDIAPPSTRVDGLPAGLDEVVLHALEKDPARRYPSARHFADELDRVVANSGGESLEGFARRALAADHEAHRRELQAHLARVGSEMIGPASRPSGVMTAQAEAEVASASASVQRPTRVPTAADLSTADIVAAVTDRPRRWRVLAIGVIVVAAALTIIALTDRDQPDDEGIATTTRTTPDGGLAPAPTPIPAPTAAPDAAASAPAEAATQPRPHRPPRSRRPDAAPAPTPPSDAATPAAVPGFALLTVAAEPYALVRLDGSEIGATPILRRKVSAGSHTIIITSPDTGELRLRRTFTLAPGAHEEIIAR